MLEEQQAVQDTSTFAAQASDEKNMLTTVNDEQNAIAVINATGIIQMSNKVRQGLRSWSSRGAVSQNPRVARGHSRGRLFCLLT